MKHKTIMQLRDSLTKVLKRGRPGQLKKLKKAYHGKRLKKWWSDYANAEETTIVECKEIEGVYKNGGMKGGHTHNHIYNVCNRITFRGKKSRRVSPADKKYFVSIFWENIALMPDVLNKILTNKRKRK